MTTYRDRFIARLAAFLGVEGPVREVMVPAPPVEYVEMLQDEPGRVYVWIARADTSDDRLAAIAEDVGRRDAKALHIIVRDIVEIRKLSPKDVRQHLLPVVKACEEAGWQ